MKNVNAIGWVWKIVPSGKKIIMDGAEWVWDKENLWLCVEKDVYGEGIQNNSL